MLDKMLTDFETKKFFLFYLRYFSIERTWEWDGKKAIWHLYLRFSIAWNHRGAHLVYRWSSRKPSAISYVYGFKGE